MIDPQQTVSLTIPLQDYHVVLLSLAGQEALSTPYDYELVVESTDPSADAAAMLCAPAGLTFLLPTGDKQYLHGIITEFSHEGQDARLNTNYRIRLRPSFFLLSLHSAFRTFQNKTVPDIVEAVFSDFGFSDFKNSLSHSYTPLEFVVQYGESTLDFVCRLLEQAGIFYFFKHEASRHTLVLADDADIHTAIPGTTKLQFAQSTASGNSFEITGSLRQSVVPGFCKLNDYAFETPSLSLVSTSGDQQLQYQMSTYPGGYKTRSDGDTISSMRLTSLEAGARVLHGLCGMTSLRAGYKFTLVGHPVQGANVEWLITSMRMGMQGDVATVQFEAMPASIEFRPALRTPRRHIHGTQTALVTGKSGEPIWTDQYGRIKVHFHWDDAGKSDETSSCWVRVAQVWAGKSFGAFFLPRVGQEVVVSFLDGDPERPLVVGSVYNVDQQVPYALPDQQTKSTFKTQGTTDTQAYNELRFEDNPGSEEVFLQAQKDLKVDVVKGDHTFSVKTGNEVIDIAGTRALTVTGDETHTNSGDFLQKLTNGDYTLKVIGDLLLHATGSVTIKGDSGVTIQSLAATTVKGAELDLQGTATAKLQGAAMTTIKGGIVMIN